MNDIKPGEKTTEFWLTVVTIVLTFVLIVLGHGAEAGLLQIGSGAYALGRGIAKRGPHY